METKAKCYMCMDTGRVHVKGCPALQAWDIEGACQCNKTWCRSCRKKSKGENNDRRNA